MRIKLKIHIFPIFLSMFLWSCYSTDVDMQNVFRYNESKGISSLDPAYARSQTLIWPVHQLFDGLVQFDSVLNIKPAIAHSWTVGKDKRTYRFELRNDVYFHDHPLFRNKNDRKVTAHDFVYSFNRIIAPETSSPGAWVFSVLDKTYGQNGFKAVNDSVLIIKLRQPFPPFLGMLGMKYCAVVPQRIVEALGKRFGHSPIGTGPFYLKKWHPNEAIVLRKNPLYYQFDEKGVRLPYLQSVFITFITDKQSEFMEFMLGNLDFISGINAQYKDALLTRQGLLRKKYHDEIFLQTGPYLNTEYLGFNLDSTTGEVVPLNVRKAINYSFSRKELVAYLRNNMAYPANNGMVPPALSRNYPEIIQGYSFNREKARKLLNKAGYKNGYPKPIPLLTTSDYVDICEYIQHQAALVGINIEIQLGTGASFRNIITKGKAPFFRGSWIADYPDAENYLALFYSQNKSPQGPNYTRYKDQRVDELYIKALNATNDSLKYSCYQQLEQTVMEFSPVVPLYYDKVVRFVRNNVQGLTVNPFNLLDLKTVKKVKTR